MLSSVNFSGINTSGINTSGLTNSLRWPFSFYAGLVCIFLMAKRRDTSDWRNSKWINCVSRLTANLSMRILEREGAAEIGNYIHMTIKESEGDTMLIRTTKTTPIMEFLKQDLLINQNIIGIIENEPAAVIYVDDVDQPTGVLVKANEYMHYLYSQNDNFLEDVSTNYLQTGFYGFSGVEESIAEKLMQKHVVSWVSPTTVYHIPEENLDLNLIKNPVSSINLEDAEEVDRFYTYKSEHSLGAIQSNIIHRPSSAVYINGELACWVLMHEDNSMGIMYTKEEHRRKGYAIDVTIDLAAKIIARGNIPYIQIVDSNSMSPGLAKKCGFVECGRSTWFGVIVGTPENFIQTNLEGKEKLLNIVGADMQDAFYLPTDNYYGMYMPMYNFNRDFSSDEDFTLLNVLEKDMYAPWCELVANLYGLTEAQREKLAQGITTATANGKSPLTPFLGLKNETPVSVSALMKFDEEVYGVYFLKTVEANESLLKLTLNETLKASLKDNCFLAFLQASEAEVKIVSEMGFIITNTFE